MDTVLLDNTLWSWLYFVLFVGGGIALGIFGNKYLKMWIDKLSEKTETKLDDVVANVIGHPTTLLIIILGLFIGNSFIVGRIHALIAKLITFLLFVAIAWVSGKLLDGLVEFYVVPWADKSDTSIDDSLIPFVNKILKIVIWVFLILMGINNLGIQIDPILNILPNLMWILALTLAVSSIWLARSAVAGLFLIFFGPFRPGDRISVGQIDGTVVEVGVWGTVIKDARGVDVLVPNHEFMMGVTKLVKVTKKEPKKETAPKSTAASETKTPAKAEASE